MNHGSLRSFTLRIAVAVLAGIVSASTLSAHQTVTLDNGQPGTSFSGTWTPGTGGTPYGANALFAKAPGRYHFRPRVEPGKYEVYLHWPIRADLSKSVTVVVVSQGVAQYVKVNQQLNGGQWNLLGTYLLDATARVTVRSRDRVVTCADAVMCFAVEETAPPVVDLPPAAPTLLAATAASNSIALDWSDAPETDFATYSIYRSLTATGTFTRVASGLASSLWTDTGVALGSTYHYVVTALDAGANESEVSNVLSATVEEPQAAPPVTLAWDAPTTREDGSTLNGLNGFKLYQGSSTGQYTISQRLGTQASHTLSGLERGSHFFAVAAIDLDGRESKVSQELQLVVE